MRAAWRSADVRAAEEALIPTLPEGTLMQRAAAGLARRCANLLADRGTYGARVLLLVGAGNNGGDALYAGARLARRGTAVSALLITPDRAHRDGLAALRAAGGTVVTGLPATADLIVDGILGIGARGAMRGAAADVVENLSTVRAPGGGRPVVVAVDVPSGVSVDTGQVEGPAVHADVTVTFGCLKPALVVGAAVANAGHVDVVDIGLPWLAVRPAAWLPELSDVRRWWPTASAMSDKYNRGVVGLATGSAAFPGAALMSVAGALAGPTGMVRYAGPVATDIVRAHPSVIPSGRVADAGRVQAWVCGCGLGTDRRAVDELRAVLGAPVPAVIDADALTLLGRDDLRTWLRRREAPTVVTPHDREYARLAGDQPGPDRLAAATELAERLGVVVLLKGDRTVVATPEGTAWVNPTGTPALATAGTGDVLSGMLGSLLAAGLAADRAAVSAAFVHGLAGRAAAERLGGEHAPVTAPDVADALREVVATIAA